MRLCGFLHSHGKSVLVSIIERILGLENITEFQPSRLSNPFKMVEYNNKHLLTAKEQMRLKA